MSVEIPEFYLSKRSVDRLPVAAMIDLGRIVTAGRLARQALLDPGLDHPIEAIRELWAIVTAGHAARDRLIEGNLPLAIKAGALHARKHGDSLDDSVGDALVGLIQGAGSYDPDDYGTVFSTIAVWSMRGRLADGRRSRRRGEVLAGGNIVIQSGLADEGQIADHRSPPVDPDDLSSINRAISACLGMLHPRSAAMIRLYYGLEDNPRLTYSAIGKKFGVSKERVRQILEESMDRIRRSTSLKKLGVAS